MTKEYNGFHGSDFNNIKSIINTNFRESTNKDEWMGYGIYFFVDGISDPIENSAEWAKNQSFSKGRLLYNKYVVFKAKIFCCRVLDTTQMDDLKAFNILRNALIKKHDEHFKRNRELECDDRVMWNLVAQVMGLDAVVHNLYIKDKVQRIKNIRSNVPNSTVLCVKKPDSIVKTSIEIVQEGEVVR